MTWKPDPQALRGRIALVAGATRGAGRGIAAALGEAGATVVCTGRTTRTGAIRSDYGRPETIEETAELVDSLGGTGVPVPCDHTDPDQVAALADRVGAEHGRLDVLVNDIWGGEGLHGPDNWDTPIWDLDLADGLRMVRLGLETHLITSHRLLPLLLDRPDGGLVVEVGDGTADYNATRYRISVFYDLVKVGVNRLAFSQGQELAPRNGTAVAITPGWMRSEMMLEAFRTTEDDWRSATAPPGFAVSETPRYVGRAVAALAADPDRRRWNQRSVSSADLARAYGFTDLDGSRPDVWRYELDGATDPAGYR
jgi:NAD(P)-dependent dehydrogenase (short-subunit alcohol dehydrogenase family)